MSDGLLRQQGAVSLLGPAHAANKDLTYGQGSANLARPFRITI
jgi:hypothetical protein